MIRTIIGEAANESPEGQAAVAHVILNRVNSGNFGQNATRVVLAPGQFEPWQTRAGELLGINRNSQQYKNIGEIVDAVAGGSPDLTGGATHFLNPTIVRQRYGGLPDWARGQSLTIGGHNFYKPGDTSYDPSKAAIQSALAPTYSDNGAEAIRSALAPQPNPQDAIRAALEK